MSLKIKILRSCTGHRFTFTQGDVCDVEDYIGKDLIGAGFAQSYEETDTGVETGKQPRKRNLKKDIENADA